MIQKLKIKSLTIHGLERSEFFSSNGYLV